MNRTLTTMSSHIYLAVQETQSIATYMKSKFADMMRNMSSVNYRPGVLIPYPEEWSMEYAVEVDLAVSIIAQAFDNQGVLISLSHK